MNQSQMVQVFVDEQSKQALEGIQKHFETVLSPINQLQASIEEMSGQIENLQDAVRDLQRRIGMKLDEIGSEVKQTSLELREVTDVLQRIDHRTAMQETAFRQLKDALLTLNWED